MPIVFGKAHCMHTHSKCLRALEHVSERLEQWKRLSVVQDCHSVHHYGSHRPGVCGLSWGHLEAWETIQPTLLVGQECSGCPTQLCTQESYIAVRGRGIQRNPYFISKQST